MICEGLDSIVKEFLKNLGQHGCNWLTSFLTKGMPLAKRPREQQQTHPVSSLASPKEILLLSASPGSK
ncbi:unnamed protein product [Caretta caretta]